MPKSNLFINTFNSLKGIYYPERIKRIIRKTNKKQTQIKKLRQTVLERKNESKEYSHPYEKHTRKSRRKYVAPPTTRVTRSMRKSQENPVEETKKKPTRKPSRSTRKAHANVSL